MMMLCCYVLFYFIYLFIYLVWFWFGWERLGLERKRQLEDISIKAICTCDKIPSSMTVAVKSKSRLFVTDIDRKKR